MKVIAKKSRPAPNNSMLGYIEPILKFDEDEKVFKKVNGPIDFPNDGEVFVFKGYNFIDNEFDHDDLFEIDDIKINEDRYDEDRAGSCYYKVTNSNIKKVNKWEFIPIYSTEFDIEKRTAKHSNGINKQAPFFIQNESYLYGPLTFDVVTLSAVTLKYFDTEVLTENNVIEEFLTEHYDCIFKYELSSIEKELSDNYVTDLNLLFENQPSEIIYFGSKEKIIEWGKRAFSSKLSDSEKELLDKLKGIEIPKTDNSSELQKIDLFQKYLNETNTWLNIELPQYFSKYLNSEEGAIYIDQFLEDNKESLFSTYKNDEIIEIENAIEQRSNQLESLNQRILENEEKLIVQEDKTFEGITNEEKTKLKDIILNEEARSLLLKYYDENRSIDSLKEELTKLVGQKEYLDSEIIKLDRRKETLQKAIKEVKSEIFEEKEFAKKVIDAKIYTDLLNNIDPSQNESKSFNISESASPSTNKKEFNTKQFIEELILRLQRNNRKVSYNDLTNYLVLLNQNFITILAGLPGVGKTSLIEKLAIVLGSYSNERYLKISVARGWTSSKDLIGYFNPLTKRYQSTKTELYQFLKRCENDSHKGVEVPSIILLDEANLSPIEHYWSEFLTLSDFDYKRSIQTTDKETIEFGSGVRFLATINYDHTTEVLSDRLLSRAPVVKINPSDYVIDDTSELDNSVTDIFTMTQLNSYLNRNGQKEHFKGDIKNKFDSIIKTLQDDETGLGQPIIIGMRKYKSVEKYCNVAGNIMDDPNKFIPLDYAINQYILPLINGRGENYVKRLIELKDKLQGLPQSLKTVNKIIQVGNDNFKTFKFFC